MVPRFTEFREVIEDYESLHRPSWLKGTIYERLVNFDSDFISPGSHRLVPRAFRKPCRPNLLNDLNCLFQCLNSVPKQSSFNRSKESFDWIQIRGIRLPFRQQMTHFKEGIHARLPHSTIESPKLSHQRQLRILHPIPPPVRITTIAEWGTRGWSPERLHRQERTSVVSRTTTQSPFDRQTELDHLWLPNCNLSSDNPRGRITVSNSCSRFALGDSSNSDDEVISPHSWKETCSIEHFHQKIWFPRWSNSLSFIFWYLRHFLMKSTLCQEIRIGVRLRWSQRGGLSPEIATNDMTIGLLLSSYSNYAIAAEFLPNPATTHTSAC
jgi:hypothetical protein